MDLKDMSQRTIFIKSQHMEWLFDLLIWDTLQKLKNIMNQLNKIILETLVINDSS